MFEEENKPSFLKVGTAQCAAFCGFLGLVLAVLLLTIGFWRTLMLAVFMLVGAFIGGVKDKRSFLQEKLSGLIPSGEKKPYRATVYPAGMVPEKKKAARPAEAAKEEEDTDGEETVEADAPETEEEEDVAGDDADEGDINEEAAAEADVETEDEDAQEDEETPWKAGPETRDGRYERSQEK